MLLEVLEGLLDQVTQRESVEAVLLLQLHGLELLPCEGVANKAQLQVEVMRILWPELASSGFVVEIDNLLDSISDIIVVFWLVADDHVSLFELHSFGWSALCGRLSLTSSRSGVR